MLSTEIFLNIVNLISGLIVTVAGAFIFFAVFVRPNTVKTFVRRDALLVIWVLGILIIILSLSMISIWLRRNIESTFAGDAGIETTLSDQIKTFATGLGIGISVAAFIVTMWTRRVSSLHFKDADERDSRLNADRLLNEAWDTLGGRPFATDLSQRITERSHLEKARRLIEEAENRAPLYARVHRLRGVWHWIQDRHSEALAAYDRAIELNPNDNKAHDNRGGALFKVGRYEDSLAAFDRALEIDPEYVKSHYNRSIVLGKLQRFEESFEAVDRAIAIDPADASAHNIRGVALGALGRIDEVLAAFNRAVEIDPEYALAHGNRGYALYDLGRFDEALAALDRAIELDPEYEEAKNIRTEVQRQIEKSHRSE